MIYNIKIGKKEISIWQSSTFLPLSGKPRKAISELDIEKLNSDNGVETTLAKFHPLYLKDVHCSAYDAHEKFKKFTRSSHMLKEVGNCN